MTDSDRAQLDSDVNACLELILEHVPLDLSSHPQRYGSKRRCPK